MNPTVKKILWPLVSLRRLYDAYLCRKDPERLFCIRYKRTTGHTLNSRNPKTLYEKIAYLAFHTDTREWSRLADKVNVREYIEECGFGEFVPQMYGAWEDASLIDFDKLPNAFVIKTNNASATNIIVKDKSTIDIDDVKNKLNKWLKWKYGLETCQPHYSRIKPLILAEELLIDEETTRQGKLLIDYKFYCVNGKPKYVMVMTDRKPNSHDVKVGIFDMDWKLYPEFKSDIHESVDEGTKCPVSFIVMQEMAAALSAKFAFCRVDFYEINGKPIFGEMTFTPGFDTFTQAFQEELGKCCQI